MIIKKVFLALMLSLCFSQIMVAQSGMTDNQVMQFMVRENERGSSRSEIVTKLIERGVQIEQIRRVRDKVEKQKSGAVDMMKNDKAVCVKITRANVALKRKVTDNVLLQLKE